MNSPGDGDKRQQILKAAVKVFSQKGFHEAKVDEIADLADVGKGTVYEYFSSKKELFQEMFKGGMRFYNDVVEKDLRPGLSCAGKLQRLARLHMKFVIKFKDLARITMVDHTDFDDEFRCWIWENRAKKLQILELIITEGINGGEFRQVNPQAAALAFSGALSALFSPIIFAGAKPEYVDLLEPVTDIILNGLSKAREA